MRSNVPTCSELYILRVLGIKFNRDPLNFYKDLLGKYDLSKCKGRIGERRWFIVETVLEKGAGTSNVIIYSLSSGMNCMRRLLWVNV